MSYSSKYLDHFTNPRGIGAIEDSDGWSEVQHEGEGCFDRVKMMLRVTNNIIQDAKFQARACSGTIASCSALVEMIIGKDINFVRKITPDDLNDYLEGVPDKKRHSLELSVKALNEALDKIN